MPKMKTHRGAAKRFSKTGTGKVKRNQANRRHLLEGKDSARKVNLRGTVIMSPSDVKRIKQLIAYMK